MAVVDLLNRCSDNNAVCEKSKLSPESLIYIYRLSLYQNCFLPFHVILQ